MKLKISLSKKVLIYYSLIAPFIMFGSAYNLIEGVILGKTPTVFVGAFSLFGFVLLPLGLYNTYKNNLCIITNNSIQIGKHEYQFSNYSVKIIEKEIPMKDRPIFSVFRKVYQDLVVQQKSTNSIVFVKDLDVIKPDIAKIESALPK